MASEVGAVEDDHGISLEPVCGVEVAVSDDSVRAEALGLVSVDLVASGWLEDEKDFCLSLGLGPPADKPAGSLRRLMFAGAACADPIGSPKRSLRSASGL